MMLQFKLYLNYTMNLPIFSEPGNLRVRKIESSLHQKINLSQHTSHQHLKSQSDQGYIVKWPSTDEVFVFSESGLHLETRTLFTDSILLQFIYDSRNRYHKLFVIYTWVESIIYSI